MKQSKPTNSRADNDKGANRDQKQSKEQIQPQLRQPQPKQPQPKQPEQKQPQQEQQAMPSSQEIKGKWKQQVGAAKIMWGKLTEDELLELEGHEQKLAGLVQERYSITREEAGKQVKKFFEQNKH